MASYPKKRSREWAREHLRGVANVVIPSYTKDLKGLNEKGIRHEIEYGFAGTLLVSQSAITRDEYCQFFEWANDESRGRLKLIHHASLNTLRRPPLSKELKKRWSYFIRKVYETTRYLSQMPGRDAHHPFH